LGKHFETPVNAGVLAGNTNVRQVHARGYNEFSDVPYYLFHETSAAISVAHSCESYGYIFTKYGEYMTDIQIGYVFWDIANNNYIRSPEFWNIVLPRVKEQVLTLDRQCT